MPLYSFECLTHGEFEIIQPLGETTASCPLCGQRYFAKVTAPARIFVQHKERLPYGSGSRGRYVSGEETGGMGILVPSWGAMEKEEVAYVTEMAVQKEKERVAKRPRESETKARLGALMDLAYRTKQGQRAKAINQAMKDL